MKSIYITRQFAISVIASWLLFFIATCGGCDRYPHSKIDVTGLSSDSEYVAIKLWKLKSDIRCTGTSPETLCDEDENLTAFKIDKSPVPAGHHFRIGLHFSAASGVYRAAIVSFAPGTGTNAGKYCVKDQSEHFILGPFREYEYFGEISIPVGPAYSNQNTAPPSVACIDINSYASQGSTSNIKPLVTSSDNSSSLKIIEGSASTQQPPPSSNLSIRGWLFRPDSQITITYTTTQSNGTSTSGTFSSTATEQNNQLVVQLRTASQIVVALTPQQNASLRGIACTAGGSCMMGGGGGGPGGSNTTVTVTVSGGGGETQFNTIP